MKPIKVYMILTVNRLQVRPVMRKPAFCIGENKGADELRGNCAADQPL